MVHLAIVLLSIMTFMQSSPSYEDIDEHGTRVVVEEQVAQSNYVWFSGYGSYYDQSPTDDTFAYRASVQQISPDNSRWAQAYIATLDCSYMGHRAIIWVENHPPLQAIVFDCARRDNADGTITWMEQSGIIFELDYYTASELGVYGGGGFEAQMQILLD